MKVTTSSKRRWGGLDRSSFQVPPPLYAEMFGPVRGNVTNIHATLPPPTQNNVNPDPIFKSDIAPISDKKEHYITTDF